MRAVRTDRPTGPPTKWVSYDAHLRLNNKCTYSTFLNEGVSYVANACRRAASVWSGGRALPTSMGKMGPLCTQDARPAARPSLRPGGSAAGGLAKLSHRPLSNSLSLLPSVRFLPSFLPSTPNICHLCPTDRPTSQTGASPAPADARMERRERPYEIETDSHSERRSLMLLNYSGWS